MHYVTLRMCVSLNPVNQITISSVLELCVYVCVRCILGGVHSLKSDDNKCLSPSSL